MKFDSQTIKAREKLNDPRSNNSHGSFSLSLSSLFLSLWSEFEIETESITLSKLAGKNWSRSVCLEAAIKTWHTNRGTSNSIGAAIPISQRWSSPCDEPVDRVHQLRGVVPLAAEFRCWQKWYDPTYCWEIERAAFDSPTIFEWMGERRWWTKVQEAEDLSIFIKMNTQWGRKGKASCMIRGNGNWCKDWRRNCLNVLNYGMWNGGFCKRVKSLRISWLKAPLNNTSTWSSELWMIDWEICVCVCVCVWKGYENQRNELMNERKQYAVWIPKQR